MIALTLSNTVYIPMRLNKQTSKPADTVIEYLGKAIDREMLRGILDVVEEAHKSKYDYEERAELIRYRLQQTLEPHWQVVVAECNYGKRCTASSTYLIHVSIGKCNYHMWRTVLV